MLQRKQTEIQVRGIICSRCTEVIKQKVSGLGYNVTEVTLGKVQFKESLTETQEDQIIEVLRELGFETVVDAQTKLFTLLNSLLNQYIEESASWKKRTSLKDYITPHISVTYDVVSKQYSDVKGITLERELVIMRIEKVKSALIEGRLSLTQIAHQYGFSSLNHLSHQFTEITGISPSRFRKNLI